MAGRPTNASKLEAGKAITPKPVATKTVAKPKEESELQSEVDSLKELVAQLMGQMKNSNVVNNTMESKEDDLDISPNKFIKVISLTDWELNLTTEYNGGGRTYSFKKYGQSKDIIYSDLSDIIHCNEKFLENGYFYIVNDKVVERHGLKEIYAKILDKKTIDNLLQMENSNIAEIFASASDLQKETIVSLLIKKAVNGEEIDQNQLRKMSKNYFRDISDMIDEATGVDSEEEE